MNTAEQRAIEMTGGSAESLNEAIDQWEAEQHAMMELFDENQSLIISFRIYDISMTLASRIIAKVEQDAGMFISQASRDKIQKFREQIQALEARRAADRQSVVDANNRRNKHETSR